MGSWSFDTGVENLTVIAHHQEVRTRIVRTKTLLKHLVPFLVCTLLAFNAHASEWCYERDLEYPKGMFGQFNDKKKTASKKVNETFKFGKDKLPERPAKMLQGLAYLEVLVNEMCFVRHDAAVDLSRKKIEKVVLDLRGSLGLPQKFTKQKMINIYWSTGELLELAEVKKNKLSKEQKHNITILRETKAALKAALKKAKDSDE